MQRLLSFGCFQLGNGEMAEFKEGDTVQLKSGGPIMTVKSLSTGGALECHWFNQEGQVFTPRWESFKPAMLRAVALQG